MLEKTTSQGELIYSFPRGCQIIFPGGGKTLFLPIFWKKITLGVCCTRGTGKKSFQIQEVRVNNVLGNKYTPWLPFLWCLLQNWFQAGLCLLKRIWNFKRIFGKFKFLQIFKIHFYRFLLFIHYWTNGNVWNVSFEFGL